MRSVKFNASASTVGNRLDRKFAHDLESQHKLGVDRPYACCDDVSVPLSCPTRQVGQAVHIWTDINYGFRLAPVEPARAVR
jgi:hypothetical protein